MSSETGVAVVADPLPMTASLADLAVRWVQEHRRPPITPEGLIRELIEIVLDGFIEQRIAKAGGTDVTPAHTLDGQPINAHDLAFAFYAAEREAAAPTTPDASVMFSKRVCVAAGGLRRFLDWEGDGDAAETRPGWTPLRLLVAREGGRGWMASRGLRYPKFLKQAGLDRRSAKTRAAVENRLNKRIANIEAIVKRRWKRSMDWPLARKMAAIIREDLSGLYKDPVAEVTIRQILEGTYPPMKKRGHTGLLNRLRDEALTAQKGARHNAAG